MNPDVFPSDAAWPYLGTLIRIAMAVALGLFVGLERERRGKEAGVRTFAFAASLGCLGGLLGDSYALASLGLMIPFIVFLNLHSLSKDSDTEMTTSAALLIMDFVGILCGKGHTFTPVAVGLCTAGLLAWKNPLSGFSLGISETELRSAILLGILAFVIFPVLPAHAIDPWGLIEPRVVWSTVILIAAIGFGNYILLKIYGSRGSEAASFLAGLVNSTVAVTELASRVRADGAARSLAVRGTFLATAAMLLRNAVLLVILSRGAFAVAVLPLAAMLIASTAVAYWPRGEEPEPDETPAMKLDSPFSLSQAIKFGAMFLVLSVVGALAQRALGGGGFYAVSALGGFVSSASSVASAGELAAHAKLSVEVGGIGAAIAAMTSALVNVPLMARIGREPSLTRAIGLGTGLVVLVGIVALPFGPLFATWAMAAIQH